MSAVWFYPSDNWPIEPTQRSGIYRGKVTTKKVELDPKCPKTRGRVQDHAPYLISVPVSGALLSHLLKVATTNHSNSRTYDSKPCRNRGEVSSRKR
ncbi:LAMI_0G00386g1_1 [Lachancea mirantina]|uniref:LAMI_0G00386g1_1 n=1 Tax=Lachancea mirantina TaxID=1230905 RepID=A0A1G4K757_9SACH|nr:LAMI_0G00386g1_1 [Lachancea mirantina]